MEIKGLWDFLKRPTFGGDDIVVDTDSVGVFPDMDLTGITTGQYLQWDGAKLVPVAGPSGGFVKSDFAEVTGDVSKSGTGYVNLLTITLTPASASNYFIVNFTASGDNSSDSDYNTRFRLSFGLTGSEVVKRSTHIFSDSADEAGSCALVYRGAASGAGQHRFIIAWEAEGGTARIQATTKANEHHASLVVQEVTG